MIELKAYSVVATSETENYINGETNLAFEAYDADEVDTYIATIRGANDEKTERIIELQKQVDKLDGVKKSAELILMNLLDCGLIKEWYFNGKFNAILKADDPHLKIAQLKQKLEDAKATAYAESVDAGMENRKLKRALWIAREWRAWCEGEFWLAVESDEPGDIYHLKCTNRIHRTPNEWMTYWQKVEQLCKKKAEEYK